MVVDLQESQRQVEQKSAEISKLEKRVDFLESEESGAREREREALRTAMAAREVSEKLTKKV